jgi:hypothetical protein
MCGSLCVVILINKWKKVFIFFNGHKVLLIETTFQHKALFVKMRTFHAFYSFVPWVLSAHFFHVEREGRLSG